MPEVEAACHSTPAVKGRGRTVHTCLLTGVPAHMHACSHMYPLTRVPAHTCACSHTCLLTCAPAHMRARSHTFLLTHMPAYTRACSRAHCAQLDSVTHTIQNPCLGTGTAHRRSNPHTSAN